MLKDKGNSKKDKKDNNNKKGSENSNKNWNGLLKEKSLSVIKPDKMENIIANVVYIIIISFSGSCYNNNSFDLANLCYYICLITFINVNRYVRKGKR